MGVSMRKFLLGFAILLCASSAIAAAPDVPKYTDANGVAGQPAAGVTDVSSQPCRKYVAITPNDGADLPASVRAIYVGVSGDVAAIGPGDTGSTSIVFKSAVAGIWQGIQARRVFATGTTATNLVGCIG
jgi:hypothetical protein